MVASNLSRDKMKIITKKELVNLLGFKTIKALKAELKKNAKMNEFGSIYWEIKNNGIVAFYSDNCKTKYQIGFNSCGGFTSIKL